MVDKIPINWGLVSHWQNWARVLLMVMIAGIAIDLFARHFVVINSNRKG